MPLNNWFSGVGMKADAEIDMVCFGSAGSGGGQFLPWNRQVPDWLRVLGVQLPGREFRYREALADSVDTLTAPIAHALLAWDKPLVFFGHSFGALLAFETARRLRALGSFSPMWLCVAGRPAPPCPLVYADDTPQLSDPDFMEGLRHFGGIDPGLLAETKVLKMFLPAIRADLHINAQYRYRPLPSFDAPIVAIRGMADAVCSHDELQAWREVTRASTQVREWPGGHFFFKDDPAPLIGFLVALCRDFAVGEDDTAHSHAAGVA